MSADSQQTTLTLQEVAEELDVHYMTAYRYVRLGMLPATKAGRSWAVTREDLDRFTAGEQVQTDRGDAPWDERLLARLLDADDSGAWAVVEAALASGYTVPEAYTDLLAPVMRRVGDLWEAGEIDVADEHVASRITTRIVARLGPRMARRGVRRGTVVLGSTQTEQHSLAATIATDLVREAGFQVVDLGVNLPPQSFAAAVEAADQPVAAAMSVTLTGQGDEVAETVAAIRKVSALPIVVGGAGASDDMASEADDVRTVGSAEELVSTLEELLAER